MSGRHRGEARTRRRGGLLAAVCGAVLVGGGVFVVWGGGDERPEAVQVSSAPRAVMPEAHPTTGEYVPPRSSTSERGKPLPRPTPTRAVRPREPDRDGRERSDGHGCPPGWPEILRDWCDGRRDRTR